MNIKKINRGFTLIESILVIAAISLSLIGVYIIFRYLTDNYTSYSEARGLHNLITRVESATSTVGTFTGMTIDTLTPIGGRFESKLDLRTIVSPDPKTLHFIYLGMGSRICSDFVNKMIRRNTGISAILNGGSIANNSDPVEIVNGCNQDTNNVTIVLNSSNTFLSANDIYRQAHPIVSSHAWTVSYSWPSGGGGGFGTAMTNFAGAEAYVNSILGGHATSPWGMPDIVYTPYCSVPGWEPAKNADGSLTNPPGCQQV